MKLLIHFKKNIFILFLPAIIIYGCGIWGNFTTYFNLYYNTVHLFDEAEKSILNNQPDLFAVYDQPLNGGDNQKLLQVIEKCSKILQFNADTRYVDDALLMLGKSFYYQQNFLKASRELEELLATQKESDLRLEAELWLGKCQIKLKKFDLGLATLKNVREQAKAEEENAILQNVLIEEIKYKISNDDLEGAIKASNDFLDVSDGDETAEKVAFELGKLYQDTKNLDGAISAYEKLLSYSPHYEMELKTKLELGKVLRDAGYLDRAFTLFDDMSNEEKNVEAFPQINLEKGITLAGSKKYDEAIATLYEVDTTYNNSQYSGAARYEIGYIYENYFNNYDSASTYYSKASSALVSPEYSKDVTSKSSIFNKYKNLLKELDLNLDQLRYKNNPDEYFKDSTSYYDQVAKLTEESKLLKNDQGNRQLSESNSRINIPYKQAMIQASLAKLGQPPVMPTVSQDSIKSRIVYSKFELGNLFLGELNRPDSALFYYNDIINNYPGSTLRPKTLFVLGNYYLSSGDSSKALKVFNEIYDKYKSNDIVNTVANILKKPLLNLEYDPAQELYQKAEDKITSSDYSGSIAGMLNIYKTYPQSELAPKALYSAGWVLENELSLFDSAAHMYDTLAAIFPQSEYSKNIQVKLSFYHQEKSSLKKVPDDSLKIAKEDKVKESLVDSAKVKTEAITENPVIKNEGDKKRVNTNIIKMLEKEGINSVSEIDSTKLNNKLPEPEAIIKKPDILKNEEVPRDTLKKIKEK